jgi:hypothetical protein
MWLNVIVRRYAPGCKVTTLLIFVTTAHKQTLKKVLYETEVLSKMYVQEFL